MEVIQRMVCPNGCKAGFSTTAHVMQLWKVDAQGNFQEVIEDCLQVTHNPDYDNTWECTKCGAEGKVFFIKVDHKKKQPVGPRFLLVNDEQGYTRLLAMGRTGEFDIVMGKIKAGADKSLARKTFEEKYPVTRGNWI